MSMDSYFANIEKQTGMTPDDFMAAAKKKGMLADGVTATQVIDWLKADYGLGYGHSGAIYKMIRDSKGPKLSVDDKVAKHFTGAKEHWRASYDKVVSKAEKFGADGVTIDPAAAYVSLKRKDKKFAVIATTKDRFDVGIKLKGVDPEGRFAASGKWNEMVTHRVQVTDPKQVDAELISWLKKAYAAAK
ncbi:MAG: DUF5655 domain-containing protein [Solirubrobacterales bacterium]